MTSATHQRLREEPRAQHERLEARADILARIAAPAGPRDLVARFHRLHADIEAAAAPGLEGLHGLEFGAPRRPAQLGRALAALGEQPAAADREAAPQAASVGEA